MQENLIRKMEGLSTLTDLYSLNLSDNLIETIEGIAGLPKLNSL